MPKYEVPAIFEYFPHKGPLAGRKFEVFIQQVSSWPSLYTQNYLELGSGAVMFELLTQDRNDFYWNAAKEGDIRITETTYPDDPNYMDPATDRKLIEKIAKWFIGPRNRALRFEEDILDMSCDHHVS
ncbi:MAG: hypothetical protein ABIH34_08350 [Nanoarchaeota archaeon]